jgi:hypothetical protein
MEYEELWPATTPDGDAVKIELWADRGRGDAEVRILHGLVLGTVDAARMGDAAPTPAPDAIARYGSEWVDAQLLEGQGILAFRLARR